MTERRETDRTPNTSDWPGEGERIAKYLAAVGVASRRDVEKMIAEGRVTVNGRRLDTPAVKVTGRETILVDGKAVGKPQATRLWRYHKPAGLVTTNRDPEGRPTIFEALPPHLPRVVTVGRLDLNTEGLLLLTNDGELARALELPATGLKRIYRARAFGKVEQKELDRLRDGIVHDGVEYRSIIARLDRIVGSNTWIDMTLIEGKKREARRALESLGLKVNRLIRVSYGPMELGDLPVGEVAEESAGEVLASFGELLCEKRRPEFHEASVVRNVRRDRSQPEPVKAPRVRTPKPAKRQAGQPGDRQDKRGDWKPVRTPGARTEVIPPRTPGKGWAKAKPRPSTGKPGKSSGGPKPSGRNPVGGRPAGGRPAGGRPTGGRPGGRRS